MLLMMCYHQRIRLYLHSWKMSRKTLFLHFQPLALPFLLSVSPISQTFWSMFWSNRSWAVSVNHRRAVAKVIFHQLIHFSRPSMLSAAADPSPGQGQEGGEAFCFPFPNWTRSPPGTINPPQWLWCNHINKFSKTLHLFTIICFFYFKKDNLLWNRFEIL